MKSAIRRLSWSLLLLGIAVADTQAQATAVGAWHGAILTPRGPLTLVVTIETDGGSLKGELESIDQAPGQKLPLAEIAATDSSLAFRIPVIGASYIATWHASASRWNGVFRQGAAMPLLLERGLPLTAPAIAGLDGTWQGSLNRNGVALRLILRVASGSGGTQVRLDSPDLAATDLVVEGFRRTADSVRFRVPAGDAGFQGVVSADGQSMDGSWSRASQPDVQIAFRRAQRVTPSEPLRTQWPLQSREYHSVDVAFANSRAPAVTLEGTLSLPAGAGPFPALVLISGSGPQDRDGTMFGHKSFAVLADHLVRVGIAVLRYDDRGSGRSSGDHASATSADFATDAAAAVDYLRTRTEIDQGAIGLAGHSEGGMIAPLAAAGNPAVSFLVLLAGPATGIPQMLLAQRRLIGPSTGLSAEYIEATEPLMMRVFEAAIAGDGPADAEVRVRAVLTPAVLDALGMTDVQRDAFVAQVSGSWFTHFLRYDAHQVLSRIDVPVLALGGTLDLQVPSVSNLPAMRSALAHIGDVTVVELPGLNHFFQTARTGVPSEYAELPETFAPAAMDRIARWITDRFCHVRAASDGQRATRSCGR